MVKFERLSFTKDWKNPTDFPTYEENEAQVRADMQLLHDEVKDFINVKLIEGIENLNFDGSGDMLAAVYDTKNRRQDVYTYAAQQDSKTLAAAKTYADNKLEAYDTTQDAKFSNVDNRFGELNQQLTSVLGAPELLAKYTTPGTYTVELPSDAALVYALAIGAGGGGACGGTHTWSEGDYSYSLCAGGGGGGGGRAVLIGPAIAKYIKDKTVVVGAGGAGGGLEGAAGGDSVVFGFTAAGGLGGGGGSMSGVHAGGASGSQSDLDRAGGSGGAGAREYSKYDFTTGHTFGETDSASEAGDASTLLSTFILDTFSAGGGGGGSSSKTSGAKGGTCQYGTGGKGGDYGAAGEDGGRCCGGGGGGANAAFGTYGPIEGAGGGKGGDGYVAIWIQRTGSAV